MMSETRIIDEVIATLKTRHNEMLELALNNAMDSAKLIECGHARLPIDMVRAIGFVNGLRIAINELEAKRGQEHA